MSATTLIDLFRAIAAGEDDRVAGILVAQPALATATLAVGATRQQPTDYFLTAIDHHAYAGDTALHIAAAAHSARIATALLERGADIRARNRRGAAPLHYAADGNPAGARWNPAAQAETVRVLLAAGADPNIVDKSGVTPLHRAIRTRCAAVVHALLDNGTSARLPNGRGSNPMDLAVRHTGRGGSGSAAAREQQQLIIALLAAHAAGPTNSL